MLNKLNGFLTRKTFIGVFTLFLDHTLEGNKVEDLVVDYKHLGMTRIYYFVSADFFWHNLPFTLNQIEKLEWVFHTWTDLAFYLTMNAHALFAKISLFGLSGKLVQKVTVIY